MDTVRSRLLSDKRGLEAVGLSSQAEQVKVQLDTVSAFPLMAVQEDPSMMEYAARDFAFSLAQIYIGKPCETTTLILANYLPLIQKFSLITKLHLTIRIIEN